VAAEPNEVTEQAAGERPYEAVPPDPPAAKSVTRNRSDRGRLHASQRSMLSRPLLEALSRVGESTRALRSLEGDFREALKPHGVIANVMFDRMWHCYLRLLLIARTEGNAVRPAEESADNDGATSRILERDVPILMVTKTLDGQRISQPSVSQLEQHLTAIGRYDKHVAREFFRALGFLLVLRDGGESDLTIGIKSLIGTRKDPHE
jgi:hypothetical protein